MMLTKAVESGEVTEAIYIEKLKAQKEKDTQMLSYFQQIGQNDKALICQKRLAKINEELDGEDD